MVESYWGRFMNDYVNSFVEQEFLDAILNDDHIQFAEYG